MMFTFSIGVALYWVAALFVYYWVIVSQWTSFMFYNECIDYTSLKFGYDYIIVGAGTAGSIVAHRLSDDPNVSVLLIDAGRITSSSLLNIPIISPFLQLSNLDWQFKTTEQKDACFSLDGHSSRWPRGKVVGGTSLLNYMMYVRGHEFDFDSWTKDRNSGWLFHEDIVPYFKKSEKQSGSYKEDRYHSTFGAMVVSDTQYSTPLSEVFLEAGGQLGFSARDVNGEHQTGFMKTQVHIHRGERFSVYQGFLASKRSNLNVLCDTLVDKVLIKDGFEAYGIEALHLNKRIRISAKRAVILSSGTIGSPSILMRSGIGPKVHLEDLEIPVIVDLPVGKNLQDHLTTGMDLILLNQSLSLEFWNIASVSSFWHYMKNGKGPWTSNGCEAFAIVHSRLSDSQKDPPDLQIMALPMGLSSDYGSYMKEAIGLNDEVWTNYFAPLIGKSVASLMPVLLHPKSRGEILLRSNDVRQAPIIDPKYLSDNADIEVLYEGIKLVKDIINTRAMQKLGAHMYNKSLPGCVTHNFDSPEYWECYIQHMSLTSYHPVGTCKMGPSADSTSVVDTDLRVHGTNRLFVIDASIMPNIPSGNINAAVMMVAEKGADSVKRIWYQSMKKKRFLKKYFEEVCDKQL